MKRTYHHFGIHVTDDIPGVDWIDLGDVKVNNPAHHPQRLEWIYHKPGTYTPGVKFQPHICYEVDDLVAAIAGKHIVTAPHEMGRFCQCAFVREDGIIVEYIQIYPGRAWFDDEVE